MSSSRRSSVGSADEHSNYFVRDLERGLFDSPNNPPAAASTFVHVDAHAVHPAEDYDYCESVDTDTVTSVDTVDSGLDHGDYGRNGVAAIDSRDDASYVIRGVHTALWGGVWRCIGAVHGRHGRGTSRLVLCSCFGSVHAGTSRRALIESWQRRSRSTRGTPATTALSLAAMPRVMKASTVPEVRARGALRGRRWEIGVRGVQAAGVGAISSLGWVAVARGLAATVCAACGACVCVHVDAVVRTAVTPVLVDPRREPDRRTTSVCAVGRQTTAVEAARDRVQAAHRRRPHPHPLLQPPATPLAIPHEGRAHRLVLHLPQRRQVTTHSGG